MLFFEDLIYPYLLQNPIFYLFLLLGVLQLLFILSVLHISLPQDLNEVLCVCLYFQAEGGYASSLISPWYKYTFVVLVFMDIIISFSFFVVYYTINF